MTLHHLLLSRLANSILLSGCLCISTMCIFQAICLSVSSSNQIHGQRRCSLCLDSNLGRFRARWTWAQSSTECPSGLAFLVKSTIYPFASAQQAEILSFWAQWRSSQHVSLLGLCLYWSYTLLTTLPSAADNRISLVDLDLPQPTSIGINHSSQSNIHDNRYRLVGPYPLFESSATPERHSRGNHWITGGPLVHF